jgi:hypothetical protein
MLNNPSNPEQPNRAAYVKQYLEANPNITYTECRDLYNAEDSRSKEFPLKYFHFAQNRIIFNKKSDKQPEQVVAPKQVKKKSAIKKRVVAVVENDNSQDIYLAVEQDLDSLIQAAIRMKNRELEAELRQARRVVSAKLVA